MSRPEGPRINIREVTADSLRGDLQSGYLNLHPDVTKAIPEMLGSGVISILVAEENKKARGQVVIEWNKPKLPALRDILGLKKGEWAPGLSFMEVPEPYRGDGIGQLLLSEALDNVRARQHKQACVVVERANTAAQRFFQRSGFRIAGFEFEAPPLLLNPDSTLGEPEVVPWDILAIDLTAPRE